MAELRDEGGPPIDTPHGDPTVAESDPPTALVRRDSFRELPPGSVVDDTYEVAARIGAGAMGEVYAARHLKLGKRVAIKVIARHLSEDAAAIERFTREARALAKIQHPAIVAVEHVGELADGRAYFVMEFLRGESLFDRLARGRVPLAEALCIIDQTARGLEAAHGSGVTHRDLKPENVFLVHLPGEPLIVKLVDFGLAKLAADVAEVAEEAFQAERTQSGVAIGTPMYMSPEQSRGPDVDHRTDIYALGCIAYELVLGRPPFPHARSAPEFWAAHLHTTPPHPRSIWPEVPPQLDLVLFAMLAKDPALRPTLAQVRAVVKTVTAPPPGRVGDRAATLFVRPRERSASRWTTLAATSALLLASIAVGMCLTAEPRGEEPSPARPAPVVPQESRPGDPPASLPRMLVDAPSPPPPAPPAAPVASPHHRHSGHGPRSLDAPAPPDARPVVDSPSPPIIDRDQTINPFKH